jgi:type III restriction enzyme
MKKLIYQDTYTKEIVEHSVRYLQDEESKLIVFQAPTGAGKTIMLAEALSRIVKTKHKKELAFVWISINYLHKQSKDKLEEYFVNERLIDCIGINEISNNQIQENQIVFVNWESLNKEGIALFMTDNEKDWNLNKVVENTKDEYREIVLIIDESDRGAKTSKAKEIINIISPKLTIEVSATPKDIASDHKVTVPLSEVIGAGMIKNEIKINLGLAKAELNEDIIRAALKKRTELKKLYQEAGTNINPLLLIQIPRKKSGEARKPEERMIEILGREGVTTTDRKLAIWLTDSDINLDYIEKNDSEVDVLIFKEAIARGWDCPRTSILLLQREWKIENYEFNIQTLGRIMRMPEQKHYEKQPALNAGYVYTASDNFSIVKELAKGYVSKDHMIIDNAVYTNIFLPNDHIRRKRELQRPSGDFKTCLLDAGKQIDKEKIKNINRGKVIFKKDIGIEGIIKVVDKEQAVEFAKEKEIIKDREEVFSDYVSFINSQKGVFTGGTRPIEIIKSSIRTLFKQHFDIGDEDRIAQIVLNPQNKDTFIEILNLAKDKYTNLPVKADEVNTDKNWQIPESISVFEDFEKIRKIEKSVLKPYFVKIDKNGKQQWSKPEKTFIDELEKTDDDVLWWFKNSAGESKYFGIAYKKNNNGHDSYYAFYPDFIVKTKKDILIVEIKDDRNFKNENLLKLNAGKKYQKEYKGKENLYFFIISPVDYSNFFRALKKQILNGFKSKFEENLVRYTQSRKVVSEKQIEKSKEDQELLELYKEELPKAIKNFNDEKLENEILKIDLQNAEATINSLKEALIYQPKVEAKQEVKGIKISSPFNICVLGEVSDEGKITQELQKYFTKQGIDTNSWGINFISNTKIQNSDVLRSLVKGQSRYNLIVTGQIHHHSGKGNKKANIISELKNTKYVPHVVGSNPQDLLTPDKALQVIDDYLRK